MRISDWSSDVCSSDLQAEAAPSFPRTLPAQPADQRHQRHPQPEVAEVPYQRARPVRRIALADRGQPAAARIGDRKSVVEGKSVSVRVDLGGRRIIKKKNNETT